MSRLCELVSLGLKSIHFLYWFLIFFIISLFVFVHITWGYVDLIQILFFVQTDLEQVDWRVVLSGFFSTLVLPLFLSVCLCVFWNRALKSGNKAKILFGCYLDGCFLFVIGMLFSSLSIPSFTNVQTDFYQQHYVHLGEVAQKYKRNVIMIFGESLEASYTVDKDGQSRIDDADAVKFDKLTEGYAQRWTQGALFSAFTGTHIHYLSEYVLLNLDKVIRRRYRDFEGLTLSSNAMGKSYDFKLPNIEALGDIVRRHGYQTLFVQGGGVEFSGTKKFLENHGFEAKNIYGINSFKETADFKRAKTWWGVSDKEMLALFKQKISQLDEDKPFLAVGFTLDLHGGKNPFYENEEAVVNATINNLNEFIAWFKKQKFYDNTTLIIVGDHQRMYQGNKPGGKIYNAFFNVPEQLKQNLNAKREFNQIDMYPTLLEIMGMELPQRKAGMGTSLFADDKTLAEKYTYYEQQDVFLKNDDFYMRLWSQEKMF